MNLSPVLKQRFFDANGLPLAGGQLFSYAAGTSTPQATYSNSTGTTNTNPVVLDAQGYADVWVDPTLSYKFVLEDANSNVLWTEDNVSYPFGVSAWNANTVYSQGAIVQDSSGQGLLYVSLANNNQGNALTNVGSWRIFGGNVRTVSTSQTSPTLLVTDDLVRSNSTSGALTHTLPPCSTTPIGKRIIVKDVGTGGNTTSVKGSGTDNVDGTNTFRTPLLQYGSLTVINNGTSWDVAQSTENATAKVQLTSGGQSYATGIYSRIPFNNVADDPLGMVNTTTGVITFPSAGRWKIYAGFMGPTAAASLMSLKTRKGVSGTYTDSQLSQGVTSSVGITTLTIEDFMKVNAGDTADVQFVQNTGGTYAGQTTTTLGWLLVQRIGN